MQTSAHRFLSLSLATGLGTGYLPIAPGTAGTVLGFILFLPVRTAPLVYAIPAWIALFATGVYVSQLSIHFLGQKDPKSVVIDEIAAIFLVMLLIPASFLWQAFGFLLFRLFDITKPVGVREAEYLPGGLGIMADDLVAALYSIALVWLFYYISLSISS
ncbi:MAG: phosphatidylglycerophosphatase A [Nitrospirota bacterium]